MASKKKECKKGYGCGNTCIQRNRACNSGLGEKAKTLINNYKELVRKITGAISGAVQAVKDKLNPPPKEFNGRATQQPPDRENTSSSLESLTKGSKGNQVIRGGSDDELDVSDVDMDNLREQGAEKKISTMATSAQARFGEDFESLDSIQSQIAVITDRVVQASKKLAKKEYSSKEEEKQLKSERDTAKKQLKPVVDQLVSAQAAIRDKFLSGSILTEDGAKNNIKQKFGEELAKPSNEKGLEGLAFLERATNGLVSENVNSLTIQKGRDYADSINGDIAITGKDSGIAAHEAMHVIEVANPEMNQYSTNYLASRTSPDGDEYVSLKESTGLAYGENEVHYEMTDPRVTKPYLLRNYDEEEYTVETREGSIDPINEIDEVTRIVKPTEVASLMVEALYDPSVLSSIYSSDPEGFKAFIGTLAAMQDKRHNQLAPSGSTTFGEYYVYST